MNFKKRFMSAVLAGLMSFTFVACGSSSTETSTSTGTTTSSSSTGDNTNTTTSGDAQYLNVMLDAEVSSLDPQVATDGMGFEVLANFTDGLMQMGTGSEAIPAIAKSFDLSEDGLTYTFYLRDDAYWSNGVAVTADDFVFGWQRAVDPDVASEYAYMLSDIGQVVNAEKIISGQMSVDELGITAVDDYTLQVDLAVPVSYFDSLMYFPTFYPVNREFYDSVGFDNYATSPSTLLSNGAFIMTDYQPAALSFTLDKNPDYYDADKVQIAGLNYQVIKDSQQAFMNYQSGALDLVALSGDQVDQVLDDPELMITGAGYMWYLTLNLDAVPELDNQNLRLAISNAINRDSIVDDVVRDGSVATFTAVPPNFCTSASGVDFSADQTVYNDICSYNPELAIEYFEKAKAELGQDTFTFDLIIEDTTEAQNSCAVLKEQLETTLVGTTFNLVTMPRKQRVESIKAGDYEICLTRWGPDYADPMTYLAMWVTGNDNNYGGWSNTEFDQIIVDCTSGAYILDLDARWEAMFDAQTIVMEEAPIIPVYTKSNANMIKSDVTGVEFHAVGLNRVYKNATKS